MRSFLLFTAACLVLSGCTITVPADGKCTPFTKRCVDAGATRPKPDAAVKKDAAVPDEDDEEPGDDDESSDESEASADAAVVRDAAVPATTSDAASLRDAGAAGDAALETDGARALPDASDPAEEPAEEEPAEEEPAEEEPVEEPAEEEPVSEPEPQGVGGACKAASDCAGEDATCLEQLPELNVRFVGGYCSLECSANRECGAGAGCPVAEALKSPLVGPILAAAPGVMSAKGCLLRCDPKANECRRGYECSSLSQLMPQLRSIPSFLRPASLNESFCVPSIALTASP